MHIVTRDVGMCMHRHSLEEWTGSIYAALTHCAVDAQAALTHLQVVGKILPVDPSTHFSRLRAIDQTKGTHGEVIGELTQLHGLAAPRRLVDVFACSTSTSFSLHAGVGTIHF